MTKTLSYPPPFQDIATLARHICCSESTIENWVRQGIFPPPVKQGGRRLWKWEEVEKHLAGLAQPGAALAAPQAGDITNATRAARQH